MKTFKSLFYSGLMIVFVPIFLIVVMVILPATVKLNKTKNTEEEKHVVIYDTIEVKKIVYDTIKPKKKIVKKKEEETKVEVIKTDTTNGD